MTPTDLALLRGSGAHVVVEGVDAPALSDEADHHLFRVVRLRDGESVTVTDGAGSWRPCVASGGALVPDGEVRFEPRREHPVTIAWAVPKRERPDWIVQKLTELGVDRIVVLHAERSVVRWDGERGARHIEKLGKVAAEAIQQSRGVWLPDIEGPVGAADVLADFVVAEPGGRQLEAADVSIAVGPEGGWTEAELERARDQVELGDRVLRVETAALVAAARALYHSS